jgi:hypothetical protein
VHHDKAAGRLQQQQQQQLLLQFLRTSCEQVLASTIAISHTIQAGVSASVNDKSCCRACLLLPPQDYYKAVMAEMYVDGAGMRGGGGQGGFARQGGSYAGGGYGSGGGGGQGGFSNGARGMEAGAGGGAGNGYEAGPSNVLRLRGLPFSAQKEDIVRWFEDCQISPVLPDK